jgi:ATP-binding cassette subfamily B (MDR/TAP) protein 1
MILLVALGGHVYLDGVDIKDLNVRWLRSQIGYVGQEPVLFKGSLTSNIAKGRAGTEHEQVGTLEAAVEMSDRHTYACGCSKGGMESDTNDLESGGAYKDDLLELVIDSAKQSNAHDFISKFPKGYETDVGESSIMVSGGQKQRIAIARALIKRPAVLLLDEATSALDSASERLVQESIDELQKSKTQTTIIIAHRLSTIMNADRIAVIDKGQVVEIGKHDDLLAKEGLYFQLWNKQCGNGAVKAAD